MDQNTWMMILIGIAVTSGLIALGVVLYPRLKNEKQGYPLEAEIESALLPFIFNGICSAYRINEQCMDEVQRRLRGVDKKALAATVYRRLPNEIKGHDVSIVKHFVTEARFEVLVQNAFDNFDEFFLLHKSHFENLFDEWKSTNVTT